PRLLIQPMDDGGSRCDCLLHDPGLQYAAPVQDRPTQSAPPQKKWLERFARLTDQESVASSAHRAHHQKSGTPNLLQAGVSGQTTMLSLVFSCVRVSGCSAKAL